MGGAVIRGEKSCWQEQVVCTVSRCVHTSHSRGKHCSKVHRILRVLFVFQGICRDLLLATTRNILAKAQTQAGQAGQADNRRTDPYFTVSGLCLSIYIDLRLFSMFYPQYTINHHHQSQQDTIQTLLHSFIFKMFSVKTVIALGLAAMATAQDQPNFRFQPYGSSDTTCEHSFCPMIARFALFPRIFPKNEQFVPSRSS